MSVPLHYDLHGPAGAPVLVLGPSLGTSLELWAPQLDALSSRYRVLRYDHRGHGGSPAPAGPYTIDDLGWDVVALLDRLGLDRVHYAGVSLGGMVGMWLAGNVPRRMDRLVLISTAAYLPPARMWSDRAGQVCRDGMESVADLALDRWLTPAFRAAEPDRARATRAMLTATPVDGYAGCCLAIGGMDLRPVLPRITAPTLVIVGTADPATPVDRSAEIVAGITGSRLVVLDEVAHLAGVQQPVRLAELIDDHVGAHGDPAG